MTETTTLQMIFNKQEEFQSKFGFVRGESDVEKTSALIHSHSAFVIEEIYEMLRELPFHKPWKDYSNLEREELVEMFEKAREEYIDVFIFMSNIGIFLGFDEELLKKMYLEKLGINHQRQEDPTLGYITGGKE